MPAKLRCFVAMAFGQKDADAIFKILRKTLGPLGINAQRVDRIEHNDNIDTRIISEIETADLVIADLTYARPSVYFEAGYAQRAIPVIFTAGSDHFRERDNDPNGNRHVHFDLKMRNIIAWSSPNDEAFLERLTRRVTKVIAPLVRSRVASQAAKERRSAFERLSTVEKGRALFDTAWSHFKRARYRELDLRRRQGENLFDPSILDTFIDAPRCVCCDEASRPKIQVRVLSNRFGCASESAPNIPSVAGIPTVPWRWIQFH